MPYMRLTAMIAMLMMLAASGSVTAEPAYPPPHGKETAQAPAVPDTRVSLNLTPAMQEVLKQTMREHLEALRAIIAALAQEDHEQASAIAHETLGFPKHHQVMQRERDVTFPKKYQELAMAHHQAAEELAKVIPTRAMKSILQQLDRTVQACVACHQAYKL